MTNFLAETVTVLEENQNTPKDIQWIGSSNKSTPLGMTWESFKQKANFEYLAERSVEYLNGISKLEPIVPKDLVIVGKERKWWLTRKVRVTGGEYQKEYWDYQTAPTIHKHYKPILQLQPMKRDQQLISNNCMRTLSLDMLNAEPYIEIEINDGHRIILQGYNKADEGSLEQISFPFVSDTLVVDHEEQELVFSAWHESIELRFDGALLYQKAELTPYYGYDNYPCVYAPSLEEAIELIQKVTFGTRKTNK